MSRFNTETELMEALLINLKREWYRFSTVLLNKTRAEATSLHVNNRVLYLKMAQSV